MTDIVRIVGEKKLVSSTSTTETKSKTIQESEETWESNKKGSGYKKVEIKLNGKMEAPSDNGLSGGEKTPEQEANLAKLVDARNFMKTEEGAKLAKSMFDQECNLSDGQRKWLKNQGIDADAFAQEWNKANPQSANNKTHNAKVAAEQKEEMGTLSNTHLGVGENREGSPEADRKLPDNRSFFQKMLKTKDKQKVKADAQHGFETATKVKMHSSTAERKGDIEHAVADDVSRSGDEYLEAYTGKSDGKKRRTFKEIDENGNIVKTKVVYNKDGSVKKVVTKSDSDGKLVVKKAKDGDITVKGNLKSDFVYEKNPDVREIHTDRFKQDAFFSDTTITNNYEQTIVEKEKCPELITPVPPAPKEPIQGGLATDFVNDNNPNGMGSVEGSVIRTEFKDHGAAAMVKDYCSFTDETAPATIKENWPSPGRKANNYNGEHIAQSLINDTEANKVNEKDLASFISELRNTKNRDALAGVKEAISRHNDNVIKLAKTIGAYDVDTNVIDMKKMQDKGLLAIGSERTVNRPVTGKEVAVAWLLQQKNL